MGADGTTAAAAPSDGEAPQRGPHLARTAVTGRNPLFGAHANCP
jgi:hypothetical protein